MVPIIEHELNAGKTVSDIIKTAINYYAEKEGIACTDVVKKNNLDGALA